MPGEAHLVVPTSCALDGHVELVAYPQVLLLEEDLQRKQQTQGEDRRDKSHEKTFSRIDITNSFQPM